MSKSTNKQSKESSAIAQAGLFSVVAIVAGVGIWSQLKTDDTPGPPPAVVPVTSPAPFASQAASEPTAMAAMPAVDYTEYAEKATDSKTPQKLDQAASGIKKEQNSPNNSPPKSVEPKIEQKKIKEEFTKKVDTPAPKQQSSASAPVVEKPKPSDFTYIQPVVSSNKASAPSTSTPNAVSSLDSAKTITVPKVQAFDPVALETVGEKAWVKISPTSTIIIEKGQELPNFGKLKEISSTQLVFEKGSIPFEKAK